MFPGRRNAALFVTSEALSREVRHVAGCRLCRRIVSSLTESREQRNPARTHGVACTAARAGMQAKRNRGVSIARFEQTKERLWLEMLRADIRASSAVDAGRRDWRRSEWSDIASGRCVGNDFCASKFVVADDVDLQFRDWHKVNAIHRAGRDAQTAASALGFEYRVHAQGCTENCIHRARGNATRAANAFRFANACDAWFGFDDRWHQDGPCQQFRYCASDRLAAGRAKVCRFAIDDGRGIGPAPGLAALFALRMRQECVHLINQSVDTGPGQGARHEDQQRNCKYREKQQRERNGERNGEHRGALAAAASVEKTRHCRNQHDACQQRNWDAA